MALSTHDELVESIINWSHRRDLDALVPDFILLTEDEIYNNQRETLKLKQLEKTSTASLTTTSRFLALPDGFSAMRSSRLDIVNEVGFIQYRTPDQLKRFDKEGQPWFYTIIGTQFEFDRVPDETYTIEIQYYGKDLALTVSNQTNEVLTNHPTIYLYGALHQLFLHAVDIEEATKYANKFIDVIVGANKTDKENRYGPAPVMRVEGSTP